MKPGETTRPVAESAQAMTPDRPRQIYEPPVGGIFEHRQDTMGAINRVRPDRGSNSDGVCGTVLQRCESMAVFGNKNRLFKQWRLQDHTENNKSSSADPSLTPGLLQQSLAACLKQTALALLRVPPRGMKSSAILPTGSSDILPTGSSDPTRRRSVVSAEHRLNTGLLMA